MTLHQLRMFAAVGKHLNVTNAAQYLGISQPSVSKQLKLLQHECGVTLIVKKGRGITLTQKGEQFLSMIVPFLEQSDHLEKYIKVRLVGHRQPKYLTIGAAESPSARLIPEVFKLFKKDHSKVQLVLRTTDARSVQDMLLNQQAELALASETLTDSRIISEPVRAEEIIAIVSARSPFARKAILTLEDMSAIPVITKLGGRITRRFEQLGARLNVVMQCESVESTKAAVRAGIGMAFLYRDAVRQELARGDLVSIRVPHLNTMNMNCFVSYRRDLPLSKEASDFIALVKAHQSVSGSA